MYFRLCKNSIGIIFYNFNLILLLTLQIIIKQSKLINIVINAGITIYTGHLYSFNQSLFICYAC